METFENVWVRKNKCKCNCNLFTHEAPKSSRNSFKGVRTFQVELEFGKVGFYGGRKTEEWPEKNPRSKDENQHQTQPMHMTPSPGIEPGPHWWEAQVLSPLLPLILWMGPPLGPRAPIYFTLLICLRSSAKEVSAARRRGLGPCEVPQNNDSWPSYIQWGKFEQKEIQRLTSVASILQKSVGTQPFGRFPAVDLPNGIMCLILL